MTLHASINGKTTILDWNPGKPNWWITVRFGEIPLHTRMSDATGIKSTLDYLAEDIPTFYDIHDAKKVYELVNLIYYI